MMAIFAIGFGLTSCNDDDNDTVVNFVDNVVRVSLPLNVDSAELVSATATLTNVQTGKTYTSSEFILVDGEYIDTLNVPEGIYNIDVKGEMTYKITGTTTKSKVKSSSENVNISKAAAIATGVTTETIALNIYNAQAGFVISEIFCAGTKTPEGKQYINDQYVKIANNSDDTLYADGLAFVDFEFMSDDKQDYTPNIMSQAISISAMYQIPGDGATYAVAPGQELLLALNAINHTADSLNPNSCDLSKADFEFYNQSEKVSNVDVDNPNVPNLICWNTNSGSYYVLHNRGFHSYALVRPEVDSATFLRDYKYNYEWIFTFGEYVIPQDGETWKIPNSWVVDAVDQSYKGGWAWNVMDASLDAGYTYVSESKSDATRYGLSVIRKKENGKFVDTNNSTNDFTPRAKASLLK